MKMKPMRATSKKSGAQTGTMKQTKLAGPKPSLFKGTYGRSVSAGAKDSRSGGKYR